MTSSAIILAAVLFALSPGEKDNAHSGLLKTPCVECHTRLPFSGGAPSLHNDIEDVCRMCHQRPHGDDAMRSHPVNRVPTMRIPPDMLLDSEGKIACITCHAFHGEYRDKDGKRRFYLRRSPGKAFCYSCHKKL